METTRARIQNEDGPFKFKVLVFADGGETGMHEELEAALDEKGEFVLRERRVVTDQQGRVKAFIVAEERADALYCFDKFFRGEVLTAKTKIYLLVRRSRTEVSCCVGRGRLPRRARQKGRRFAQGGARRAQGPRARRRQRRTRLDAVLEEELRRRILPGEGSEAHEGRQRENPRRAGTRRLHQRKATLYTN